MSRLGPLALLPALLLALVPAASCIRQAACFRDTDCTREEVCFFDQHCLPRDVAGRAGPPLGAECTADAECSPPAFCRAGYCLGAAADVPAADARIVDAAPPKDAARDAPRDAPAADGPHPPDAHRPDAGDVTPPDFAGLQGVDPDGEGVLLAYWSTPLDDHTLPLLIDVDIFRGTTEIDLTRPIATVRGDRFFADTDLEVGRSYVYLARARDGAGNVDRNGRTWVATPKHVPVVPPGVDFTTQVLPIFASRCTICHGGSSGLTLASHATLLAGGMHGPVVVPCEPDASNLVGKLGPKPPFGLRMPRSGPPYLSMDEFALIRQWIKDGAGARYDPAACTPAARDAGPVDGGPRDGGARDAGARDGATSPRRHP